MRVCVVSFKECWPDGRGGWCSDGGFPHQMRALATLFDEMSLLVVGTEPRPGGTPLPDGATVHAVPAPAGRDARRKLAVAVGLRSYLRAIGAAIRTADVVHLPLPGDIPLLGLGVALRHRKRVLARYGGAWSPDRRTTIMNRVTRAALRACARRGHVVLATGAGTGPPAAGIEWIFATAISEAEVAAVRPDLARPLCRPAQLVYAGRLSEEKGVDDLLAAVAHLRRDRGLDTRLAIVGDGPLRPSLERRVGRMELSDHVTFSGAVDRAGLLRTLVDADLCVLPSLTESWCKARLDAFLCGTPVVTTAAGFGRLLVGEDGDRGWIAPAGDPAGLATTIAAALTANRDWTALRTRCRSFAERHTLEAWASAIGDACRTRWGVSLRASERRA